jgi:Ran GTPase-activating protein (RanGAP) involved in mRNA processing and transport
MYHFSEGICKNSEL